MTVGLLLLAATTLVHAPLPERDGVIDPAKLTPLAAESSVTGTPRAIPNQFPDPLTIPAGDLSQEWPRRDSDVTVVSPELSASAPAAAPDAFPTIDVRFDSLYDGGTYPPDAVLAVGKNNLVVLVNLQIAMYSKSGVLQQGPFSLGSFFGIPSGFGAFDPQAVYDPFSDRFIVSTLADNGSTKDSRIYVAFSQTNSATGAWNKYFIHADLNQTPNWADYHSIGLDRNAVYFTANMFNRSNAFQNATLFIYSKDDGYAGVALRNTHIIDFRTQAGGQSYRTRPAYVPEVVAGDEYYLAHTDSSIGSVVNFWRLTGPRFNSPTLTASSVAAPSQWFPIGNARQPGSGGGIATLGTNVWNAFYRGGKLWVTQVVSGAAGLATWVHRIKVSSTPAVREQTYQVEESAKDLSFAYVIPDTEDNDFALFSEYSSTANYGSGKYWNVSAAGTIRTSELTGTGTLRNESGRHGDYLAVGVDPNDPNRLWAITEYQKNSSFTSNALVTSVRFEEVPPPTNPAPVPDGKAVLGQELKVSKAAGGNLTITYDALACNTPDHHVVWYNLASISSYQINTVSCDAGSTGSWTGAPPAGNLGILMVSDDNAVTEGSYGVNSAGSERPSSTTLCGISVKSVAGQCGP